MSKSCKIKLGITMGDPCGIGPSIVKKALKEIEAKAEFILIGDKWVLDQAWGPAIDSRKINIVDLNNVSRSNFRFGRTRPEYGRASMEYLDVAMELIKKKEIEGLVTCPISKESINKAGFNYSGHTEYFLRHTQTRDAVMMLLNKGLRFSLVTRHIPLAQVPRQLAQDKIYKTISLTHDSLKKLFFIRNPRLVVCGLNPHASDNGLIGDEEARVIIPALNNLKRTIKCLDGPLSSDVAIAMARQKKYDAVIAMYHDQALIPLKFSGNRTGVNITLGLPFIRTSPLHGTAFDIAATNSSDPASLIEAIRTAVKCTANLRKV